MKQTTALLLLALSGCAANPAPPQSGAEPALQSDQQKSSYAQGVRYMRLLKSSEIPLDQALFMLGVNDVLAGRPIRLNDAELQKGEDWVFVQRVQYGQKLAAANLTKGQAFLDANKQQPGVTATASGLQYKVLQPGQGSAKPSAKDSALVHFRISRLDGKELTNTAGQATPVEVQVGSLIAGWQEAMQLMNEGAKWQLFIPAELAYGEAGAPDGRLGPNEALVYEVELLKILPPSQANSTATGLTPASEVKQTSSWKVN
jgi:FKBP-type peptidyl-prolyl cis-trans isomerase